MLRPWRGGRCSRSSRRRPGRRSGEARGGVRSGPDGLGMRLARRVEARRLQARRRRPRPREASRRSWRIPRRRLEEGPAAGLRRRGGRGVRAVGLCRGAGRFSTTPPGVPGAGPGASRMCARRCRWVRRHADSLGVKSGSGRRLGRIGLRHLAALAGTLPDGRSIPTAGAAGSWTAATSRASRMRWSTSTALPICRTSGATGWRPR